MCGRVKEVPSDAEVEASLQKLVGDDKTYKIPKTLHGARPPKDPVKFAEWMAKMEKHVAEQLRKRAAKTKEEAAAPQAGPTESTSKEINAEPEKAMKSKKQASSEKKEAAKKVKSKADKDGQSKRGPKTLSPWALFVKERMPTMSGSDTKDNMKKVAAMWRQEKEAFTKNMLD